MDIKTSPEHGIVEDPRFGKVTDKVPLEVTANPEHGIVEDPRFSKVTDKVPLISYFEIQDLIPKDELVTEAIVQRTAQINSPFFEFSSVNNGGQLPLEQLGVGLEDKLLDVEKSPGVKFTPKDTALYFADEGKRVRQFIEHSFPRYAGIIDKLATDGEIINTGSEIGHVQIRMLLELDREIGRMVWRLNGNPDRREGHLAYDFRRKIYDKLRTAGIPVNRLIHYTNGDRILALPKFDRNQLDGDTGIKKERLDEALSILNPGQLKDWKLVRNAVFLLSDPRIRDVLETNGDVPQLGIRRAVLKRYPIQFKTPADSEN